jgi:hypothetical protein
MYHSAGRPVRGMGLAVARLHARVPFVAPSSFQHTGRSSIPAGSALTSNYGPVCHAPSWSTTVDWLAQ